MYASAPGRQDSEPSVELSPSEYALGDQIIHCLRRAHQRCAAIFAETTGTAQVTPTQWAVLVTLLQEGPLSQNQLGRATFMDPATSQGVIVRLAERKLVDRRADADDRRRTIVSLTRAGEALVGRVAATAKAGNDAMLAPLTAEERTVLMGLLAKLM